jgi:hypothetical protein
MRETVFGLSAPDAIWTAAANERRTAMTDRELKFITRKLQAGASGVNPVRFRNPKKSPPMSQMIRVSYRKSSFSGFHWV